MTLSTRMSAHTVANGCKGAHVELVLALFRVAAASAASMLAPVRAPPGSSAPGAGSPSTSFAAAPCTEHWEFEAASVLHWICRLC